MDPVIINRRPSAGAGDIDGLQELRFGVRDIDTRVGRSSVRALLAYSRIVYEGDKVPSRDPAITGVGEGRAYEGRFSDAIPVQPLGTPAAFTPVSGGLQITKTLGTDQESFVFVSDRLVPDGPVALEVDLQVVQHTDSLPAGSFNFYDQADFAGIVVGLLNWRRKSGIYILFKDDGVTRTLALTGPALTASGSRTLLAPEVVVDWAAGSVRLRLVWDDTPGHRALFFIVDDGTTEQAVALDSAAVASLVSAGMVAGLRIAGMSTSASADRVMAVVGTAGPAIGDSVIIERLALSGYGIPLAISGEVTSSALLTRAPNTAVPLRAGERDWEAGGGLEVSEDTGNVVLEAEDDGIPALLVRDETDLVHESWLLVARLSVPVLERATGTVYLGPEVRLSDGTQEFVLALLDDSEVRHVGLYSGSGSGDALADYAYGGEHDWTLPTTLALMGSAALGLRLEVDDSEYLTSAIYSDLAAGLDTKTRVQVGWGPGGGRLHISGLWLFPNATFAEPSLGSLPEAQGWDKTVVGSATSALDSGRYVIDAPASGDRLIYSVSPGVYEGDAGGAWHFRGRVRSWTDTYGAPSPENVEIGPVALVQYDTTKAATLSFVELEGGRGYAFIGSSADDLHDVVARTPRGVSISTPLNLDQTFTAIFEVKPGAYARLYLNYGTDPAIDVPWDELVKRTSPSGLPAGAAGAFGAIGETGGLGLDVVFARFGIGRGYDFVAEPSLTEDVLEEWVYGSDATLYVDLEDV